MELPLATVSCFIELVKSGRSHLRPGMRGGYVIIVGVIGGEGIVVGGGWKRDGGLVRVRGQAYG